MRLDIRDRALVAELVDELVKHLGNGSQELAAERIGVSTAMVSFLRRGTRDRIDYTTVRRLEHAITLHARYLRGAGDPTAREEEERLNGLLARGVARIDSGAREQACDEWITERTERLVRLDKPRWDVAGESVTEVAARTPTDGPGTAPVAKGAPLLTRKVEVLRKRAIVAARATIEANRGTAKHIARLLAFCERKGIRKDRYELAIVRIIEPLVESNESGFVERHWSELSESELSDFVAAGVRRELILLKSWDLEKRASLPPPPAAI